MQCQPHPSINNNSPTPALLGFVTQCNLVLLLSEEHRLTVATSPSGEWPDQVLEMLHILQTFH